MSLAVGYQRNHIKFDTRKCLDQFNCTLIVSRLQIKRNIRLLIRTRSFYRNHVFRSTVPLS